MKPLKRIYVGLIAVIFLLLASFGALIWYYSTRRPEDISHLIIIIVAIVFLLVLPVIALGLVGIILTITRDRPFPTFRGFIRITMDLVYPVTIFLGKVFGISKEKIHASYVEVNNRLVRVYRSKVKAEQVLVLLPHCLQWRDCPHKITADIENCRRCGRCDISELVAVKQEYGVRMSVATGGSQARREVKEVRPRFIVAVACERELSEGIQDVNVIPVLGVPNQRPNGPCFNTKVDVAKVRETIEEILKEGDD